MKSSKMVLNQIWTTPTSLPYNLYYLLDTHTMFLFWTTCLVTFLRKLKNRLLGLNHLVFSEKNSEQDLWV